MSHYAIITPEQFEANIPDFVNDYMEYPEVYPLKDCIFGTPRQLENGNWVVDCRFRSYDRTEIYLDGVKIQEAKGISCNNTRRELSGQEVNQWRSWVGLENVMNEEQIIGLIYKDTEYGI